MYDKRSNEKEGWSLEKTGVFGGDSGQDFLDGTISGSDEWRPHISLIVENGEGEGTVIR